MYTTKTLTITLGLVALTVAGQAVAQVTLYEREGLHGQVFTADRSVSDLERYGFNDRASSLIVQRGQWQVCEHANFEGHCTVLRPGQYASLAAMGMNNRISSLRKVQGSSKHAYASQPSVPAPYPYYPQYGERLYPANVVAVRAVMGPPEQRCWVEQQQVAQSNSPNIPGAIIGGVLGGVLGHQIGNGRGNDVATAVGAVGGAAIGANVNRGSQTTTQNVQRCASAPSETPAYWDVTYVFRGVQHRAQLNFAPGATINVNSTGEPRV
jgi:uncharacterized protein YcfJ